MNQLGKKIVKLLKKLPVDIGQAERKHTSAGKKIAISFISKVSKSQNKTALDIGCRDGYWSKWLVKQGYKVTSLDIEPHFKGAIQHDLNEGLPFKNNTFDLVLCTEVIEHVQKPSYLLTEIDRVLKPKGISVITTPNSNWFLYWFLKPLGWTPAMLQNPDHKHFFNESMIRSVCRGYRLYGYFPYMFIFLRLDFWIGLLSPTFILIRLKR